MKKLFLSMILLALPILASAYDCQVDGIYYNLNSEKKTATVTYQMYDRNNKWPPGYSDYSGSVTIPEKFIYEGVEYTVTTIGYSAFSYCNGLTSVTIPNSVISIGEGAFYGCSRMASVTIPNSVTFIEDFAFYNCTGLTSVTIPNSVISIGEGAFYGCSGMASVTIPNSVTSIENDAFCGCSSLTSVTIPNSVMSIGNYAFRGCSGLTSVTIPNSVITIGYRAFDGCSGLTSVTIGNSVTSIGIDAFYGCKNIETIYSKISKLFEIQENVFSSETYINAKLMIPEGTTYKYKNTAAWNKFLTIEESDFSGDDVSEGDMVELSLQDSERGEMSIALEKGKSYTLTITPATGWKVYMIIFNSKNVTDQLSGNKFTIPALTSNSYLNISYEQTSDVNSAKSIPVLISAKGGNISVKCEAEGQEVNVYTIDGLSLGAATVKNGEALISTSIPSGDIAVVKVGGRSVKVIMR